MRQLAQAREVIEPIAAARLVGVTEPPETTAARRSAILVSSPRSVESEP